MRSLEENMDNRSAGNRQMLIGLHLGNGYGSTAGCLAHAWSGR